MTLGAFNQVSWSGVGDVDECWIIATYWALVATGVMEREDLPSIAKFRAAAGNPDRPGSTGGNNTQLMKALQALAPQADAQKYDGGTAGFAKALKQGYVASLSVMSRLLPSYLRFGYLGAHQISVYYQGGKYYVMNPLQKEGAALIEAPLAALLRASGGLFGDNRLHAVLIKKKAVKAIQSKGATERPAPPRDLNTNPVPRNFLNPFRAKKFYDAKHKPGEGILPTGNRRIL